MKHILMLPMFFVVAYGITWQPHNSTTNTGDLNSAKFCEDMEVTNTPFYTLVATGSSNIKYEITGAEFLVYVDLNENTGELTLLEQIDRETTPSFTINVKATAGTESDIETSTIDISDANDNDPFFLGLPYSKSVLEYPWTNKTVLVAEATDIDDGYAGSVRTYTFEEATNQLNFTGYPHYMVLVNENAKIDYESSPVISATITAEDGGSAACGGSETRKASAPVLVTVLDGPDRPPIFTSAPYYVTIEENRQEDLVQVEARDQDYSLNWEIEYSLVEQEAKNILTIDSTTGQIAVTGDIDADSNQNNGVFQFSVMAKEKVPADNTFPDMGIGFPLNATTTISVTVEDINDNKPIFYRVTDSSTNNIIKENNFNATIEENTSNFITIPGINMFVKDLDQADNAVFSLSTTSNAFEVVPSEVNGEANINLRVKDSTLLDFETTKEFQVEIVAREMRTTEKFSASATVVIELTDENDNSPEFGQDTFSAKVKEDAKVGTPVAFINATDKDTGINKEITYSILPPDIFAINPNTSEVRVNANLDREKISKYYLSVRATDGGNRFTTTTLDITILDVNDEIPRFQRSSYSAVIKEGDVEFNPNVAVYAVDDDESNTTNSMVKYYVANGELSDNFTMDPPDAQYQKEGNLLLNSPLDFESLPESLVKCENGAVGVILLTIVAEDQGSPKQSSSVNITITVEDVNDHKPFFENGTYQIEVAERTSALTEVLKLKAFDMDTCSPNNLLDYSISSDDTSDSFIIETMVEDDHRIGVLKTKDSNLDHEDVSSYTIKILATDGGSTRKTGTATVEITVTDINDVAPQFGNIPSSFDVEENNPLAEILHLNATDVDEDHNLNFSLNTVECEDESGNNLLPSYCNGYFNIDTIHEVGVLSLIKELDRETIERFTLTIEVIDMNAVNVFGSQNALKTISILVLDINDNSPVFISTPQSFSVNEGVEASAFVGQVTATDPDKGDNGTVTYTVTGNYSDYFTLSNTNPTKGQLSTLKVIDRETVGDVLNITIVASDEGIPSPRFTSIVVAVKINDINDNSPIYTQTNYSTAIAETVQFPDHVITVHADDLDSLEKGFGEIMYTIIRGDDYSQFAMNHTTGEITVAQGKNFDREAKAEYVLTVEASDDRGQTGSHKTTVEVKIKIDDFNDCPPQFTQDIYRVSFREDGEVGDSVGTVSAEDLDVGENSKIKYSIVGGNDDGHFRISESSGEVALLKSIRNKESKYLLTINATDNGTVPLSSMCQMQIDVIDANINFPEFQNIEFGQEIFLAENSPTQELVFQVIASDKDRGENGHVHFILLNNLDNFQIGYESGNITLLSNMDRETTERYALNIMAEDGGNPPRSEETQLIIVVTDVDDNPPFYLPDSNTQFISVEEEKSPFTIEIPVLGAQDKDLPENTQNYYFIVGGTGVGNFSLDKETRFLTTLIKFDHEQTDSYDLIVKASNDPEYLANNRQRKNIAWNPDDNSLLHVICTITDINDNLPVFTKEIYETDVPFDTQPDPDITIIQVWATDIDTGLAEVPTYSIKSSMWVLHGNSFNRSGTFGIQPSRDNTKGDIYLASAIDGDQDGKYELIIRATDSNLKHVAETTVSIGIVKADETVILYSRYTPSEFESMEDEFVADMEALLHAKVYLDKVIQHNKQNSLYQEAESDIYFHAKNGTYLIPKQEIIAILGQKESYPVLGEYGIVGNGEVATEEVDRTEDYLKATAIILGAVLGVAIVIFTIAICCMRQSYKRKLKVKEAAEQTSHDMEDIQEGRGSSHVPNTNVFNSNPLHEIKESQQGIQLDWQLTRESRDDDDDDSIDDNAVESNDSAIGENLDQEEDEPVDNQFDIDFDPKGGANNAQLAAALNAANRRMGGENLTFIFDDEVANGNTAL